MKLSKGGKSLAATHLALLMKASDNRQRDRIVQKFLKDHAQKDTQPLKDLQKVRKAYHNVYIKNVRLQKKLDAFKAKGSKPKATAKMHHKSAQTSNDLEVQSEPQPIAMVPSEIEALLSPVYSSSV